MQTLPDWENHLREQLKVVDLIGELDLSPEQTDEIARLIKQEIRRWDAAEGTDWLRRHYPCALAAFLVFQGMYGYESGNFWSAICDAVGVVHSPYHTQQWGLAFEAAIRRLGLVHPSTGHRFVGAILGHGGIPRKSLPDFFEHIMQPSVTRPELAGLTTSELIHEWLGRSARYQVDKPVLRFLEYGGLVAEDFVNRCRQLLQDHGETGEVPSAEQIGLPVSVIEAYRNWTDSHGGIRGVHPTGSRLRAPFITLDPWGFGVTVVLPEQQIPSLQSQTRVRWVVVTDQTRQERVARVRRVDFDLKSEEAQLPLTTPERRYVIRLYFENSLQREWIFEGVSDDCSFLAFDPETGRLLPSSRRLLARPLWLLYPANADLAIDGQPVDAMVRELLPQLPWGWSNWRGQEVDLSRAHTLTITAASLSRDSLILHEKGIRRPELIGGHRVILLDQAIPLFAGELPRLKVWTKSQSSPEDTLHRWRLELRSEFDTDPVVDRSDRLVDLTGLLAWDGESVELPVAALLGGKPIGQYRLRVRGPLGSDSELRFRVVPWLDLTGHEQPFIPDPVNGAPVVPLLIESDRQTTVEILQVEPGFTVQEVSCTDEARCYEASVPPSATVAPLRIIRDLSTGKRAYVPLRIPIRRLRWMFVPDPRALLTPEWRDTSISTSLDELDQSEFPLLLIELPVDRTDRDMGAWLRLLDSYGAELPGLSTESSDRQSRFRRFDLRQIRDTLRQSEAPAIRAELTVIGIQGAPKVQLPCMTFKREVVLEAMAVELTSLSDHSVFSISWEPKLRIRGKVVRIWSLTRPWMDPIVLAIPDPAHQQHIADPAPVGIVPGEYLVQLVVEDPWLSSPTPEHSPSYGANLFRCPVGDMGQRMTELETTLVNDTPDRAFPAACEMAFLARSLDDRSRLEESLKWCYEHIEHASAEQLLALIEEFSEQAVARNLRSRMFRSARIKRMLERHRRGDLSDWAWRAYLDQLPSLDRLSLPALQMLLSVPDERVQLSAARVLIEQGNKAGLAAAYRWQEEGKLSKSALSELLALNRSLAVSFTPSYFVRRASELSVDECVYAALNSDLDELRMAAVSSLLERNHPDGVMTTSVLVGRRVIDIAKGMQLLDSNTDLTLEVLRSELSHRLSKELVRRWLANHQDQTSVHVDGWVKCRFGWGQILQIHRTENGLLRQLVPQEDLNAGYRLSVRLLLTDGVVDAVIDTGESKVIFAGQPRLYICIRCESFVAHEYEKVIAHYRVAHGSNRERKFRFFNSACAFTQTEPLEFSQYQPSVKRSIVR